MLLAPVYALCCLVVLSKLSRSRGIIWILIFLAAVLLTLIPAHLFEFRYFTPAAMVAVLNMPEVSNEIFEEIVVFCYFVKKPMNVLSYQYMFQMTCKGGIAAVSCSALLNLILMAIFLNPFSWRDGTEARFML